jgi:flagellar biosynthesis/type III secretory pathway M-ring protein FliF/YscJ
MRPVDMSVRPLPALLRHLRLGLLGLCLTFALSACKVELHSGLNETEANQIVALLMDAGLSAEKRKDKEGVTVLVEESRFSDAVALLRAHGLPRQSFDAFCMMRTRSISREISVASSRPSWPRNDSGPIVA